MLSDCLFRVPRREGLHVIQQRGARGARELTTHRITLSPGGKVAYVSADEETVVVLQQGRGTFAAGTGLWPVSRQSVFGERATALLLPPDTRLQVIADTPLEAVLVSAPAEAGGHPVLCTPDEVVVNARGRDLYRRDVHTLFVSDPHGRRLMVGETFNAAGNWSSYPPHKHDGRDGEPVLEEVYYYRVDPPGGFGLQMQYTADGEQAAHQVHDGDLVLLPYGYHPTCVPPGYRLYYLWALAGAQRQLAVYEDPAYRWVHDAVS
jgi:5-deoxy-glucuronate isomerase